MLTNLTDSISTSVTSKATPRFPTLDRARLARDIAEVAGECTALKRLLGTRWLRPMAEEQRRLARQRRRVTDLLALLAESRGRLHRRHPPRELDTPEARAAWDAALFQRTVATRILPEYDLTTTMAGSSS